MRAGKEKTVQRKEFTGAIPRWLRYGEDYFVIHMASNRQQIRLLEQELEYLPTLVAEFHWR